MRNTIECGFKIGEDCIKLKCNFLVRRYKKCKTKKVRGRGSSWDKTKMLKDDNGMRTIEKKRMNNGLKYLT